MESKHALALALLPGGQSIAPVRKRIVGGFKLQTNGGACKLKHLAQVVHEITLVAVGNVLCLIAVDDKSRWVSPALMYIA